MNKPFPNKPPFSQLRPCDRVQTWPQALVAHRAWLSAVIFARVRDRHAVEEVLQETALAATCGELPGDPTGISRWLYRVAIRQSALYRRRAGRNEKKCHGYAETALARSSDVATRQNPYAILEASEQTQLVRESMKRLGNGDCEILLLKYTEEWSCQEIARRLGVSQSAIKSRLLRARGNLRRELLRVSTTWDVK